MKNFSTNSTVMRPMESPSEGIPVQKFLIMIVLVILVGVGIGYGVFRIKGGKGNVTSSASGSTEKAAGIVDKKTFPDSAEGKLVEGGLDGEGNFHLERTGGESQNVYLTSSTVDLSQYIGKKVKVWGQTFTGEKAGWLMDVGYVEVL